MGARGEHPKRNLRRIGQWAIMSPLYSSAFSVRCKSSLQPTVLPFIYQFSCDANYYLSIRFYYRSRFPNRIIWTSIHSMHLIIILRTQFTVHHSLIIIIFYSLPRFLIILHLHFRMSHLSLIINFNFNQHIISLFLQNLPFPLVKLTFFVILSNGYCICMWIR